jgi:PBP1b-binding outer membrane lipoprotein LpoB
MRYRVFATLFSGFAVSALFFGCSSPEVSRHGIVTSDEEVIPGGVSSNDIRTVASEMCPAILSIPDIAGSNGVVRVAMAPMRNSSRFIVDMNIFMKRLRLELNRYSAGKLRFFASDNVAGTRTAVLKGRTEENVEKALDGLADDIVALPLVKNAANPLRIAVLPVVNVNFVKLNADSFISILRGKLAEKAKGKVVFVSPSAPADYYLAGQFIAQGMKKEGMINLVDYIGMMDERIKKNESLDLYNDDTSSIGEGNTGNQLNIIKGDWKRRYPSLFNQLQISARLRSEPNVTKRLNVMLAKPGGKTVVWEKMITVEKKITSGIEKAKYILSGEVNGLSKRANGEQSDYLLITVQLVDPDSNEVLWEDGYEVKKKSAAGTVYQ